VKEGKIPCFKDKEAEERLFFFSFLSYLWNNQYYV